MSPLATQQERSTMNPPRKCGAGRSTYIVSKVVAQIILSAAALAASTVSAAVFDTPGKATLLSVQATGVQIYECHKDDSGQLAWKFREPLAILLADGQTIGRHYAGPSWQLNDGSKVTGKVVAQKPGATEQDIAQLQLAITIREGSGLLAQATTVERLDTHGGAFAGECQQAGTLHVEPYTAQYVFLSDNAKQ